jgi:penicillin-binding protein 2
MTTCHRIRRIVLTTWALAALGVFGQAPPVPRIVEEPAAPPPVPKIVIEEGGPDAPAAPKAKVIPEDGTPPLPLPPAEEIRPAKPAKEEKKPPAPEEQPKATDEILKPKAVKPGDEKANTATPTPPKQPKSSIPVSETNDRNARTLFLTIPAPRGQIVDRNGNPLAQCRMAYFLGIQFTLGAGASDSEVLQFAKERMPFINKHLPDGWTIEDQDILAHYKNRRWMPLLAGRPIPTEPTEDARKALPLGVVMIPCYLRWYPNGTTASHLLGEMGRTGGMPTGPIQNGDQLWPFTEGKSGLEKRFEAQLAGTPGKVNIVFSATGEKVSEEIVERPKPGRTIVTSLDLDMQKLVERVLRDRTRRGAMVVMDIQTGDILAMASNPGYDPNLYAFGIRDTDFQALLKNKDNPLLNRAINAKYPPASSFKPMTAFAALESGKVDGSTYFDCTGGMKIGNIWKANWHSADEGPMNVVDAMKRSCNTWFYKAAIEAGATAVTSMAVRFGLGEKTGLCLPELAGTVPTPEWWRSKHKGANMTHGDLANVAIGQGDVEVTPLQDCAMMAGIGRGTSVPGSRLVQQVQDIDGSITEFFAPEVRKELGLDQENLRLVREGMRAVVEEPDGTGKAASNPYVDVAGKTGTCQWRLDDDGDWIHMAWFAGYIPAKDPQYAYAAIYEGDPGEGSISGGKKVAPLVGDVFDEVYKRKKQAGESMAGPAGPDSPRTEEVRKAKPVAEAKPAQPEPAPADQPAPAPAPRQGGLRWLWNKLRGK